MYYLQFKTVSNLYVKKVGDFTDSSYPIGNDIGFLTVNDLIHAISGTHVLHDNQEYRIQFRPVNNERVVE